MRAVEATAPTRVDLAGGTLDVWPLYLLHPGAFAIGVALDRRVWCRVTTGVNGVRIESKDTLANVEGRDLSEVLVKGSHPLIANVLRALGIETGLHVVTQARVPAGSGLGVSSALAIAVAAAAARAIGHSPSHEELWALVRDAETRTSGAPTGVLDYQTALLGGVVDVRLQPGRHAVQRLAADPSRVEEHLLLVETSATRLHGTWDLVKRRIDGDPEAIGALDAITSVAQRLRGALGDQRYRDVAPLLREEWVARKALHPAATTPEIDRIVETATSVGGAARPCGDGSTVAVWIDPDARGGVMDGLKALGVRAVPVRADLMGLSVEELV